MPFPPTFPPSTRSLAAFLTLAWIVAFSDSASAESARDDLRFESKLLGATKPLHVYLPPGYDASGEVKYPVLYYLHGLNNTARRFFDEGLPEITDRLIEEAKIPPLLIVSPTGDYSFYVNKFDGSAPYEDYVVTEVREFVESSYPVRTDPLGRAIGGISMGGFGAMKIGMKFVDLYSSVSAHTPYLVRSIPSAERKDRRSRSNRRILTRIFGDPIDMKLWADNDPFQLSTSRDIGGMNLYFNSASRDRYFLNIDSNAFHKHLDDKGIEHVFRPIDDVHGWVSLRNNWAEILAFHSEHFGDPPLAATGK